MPSPKFIAVSSLNVLPAFLNIPPAQFKLVLDSVIWAFKHTMRNVADTGLSILFQMLQNVAQEESAAQSFYQTYYTDVLQHIFSVVTDSSHTAGEQYSLGVVQNLPIVICFLGSTRDEKRIVLPVTFFT